MRMTLGLLSLFAVFGASAEPTISDIAIVRDAGNHLLRVTYGLSESAIVTASFTADGVEVGPDVIGADMGGDVNKVVAAGSRTIFVRTRVGSGDYLHDVKDLRAALRAWPKSSPPRYLSVDLTGARSHRFYVDENWVPGGVSNRLYKTDRLLMRRIAATDVAWPMGVTGVSETKGSTDMSPHYVSLSSDYYIGIYEVTQRQYKNCTGELDGSTVGGTTHTTFFNSEVRPVAFTSYSNLRYGKATGLKEVDYKGYVWPTDDHAVNPESGIGRMRSQTGLRLDLPTEAQWEYAARAGSAAVTYGEIGEIAWTATNFAEDPAIVACGGTNQTHEVGLLKPNKWGLYDMIGNVQEVCLDVCPNSGDDIDIYKDQGQDAAHPVVNPVGPEGSGHAAFDSRRARRGQMYTTKANNASMRVAYRNANTGAAQYDYSGVRVVCPVEIP